MSKVKLTSGFTLIPEGTDVFKVVDVEYNEKFGKIKVTLRNADGLQQKEQYSIANPKTGEINEGAMNAFSYFAKNALNDMSADEIDPEDLVGYYVQADVQHDLVEGTDANTGKSVIRTFAHLRNYSPADGFDREEKAPAQKKIEKPADYKAEPATVAKLADLNLDEILG